MISFNQNLYLFKDILNKTTKGSMGVLTFKIIEVIYIFNFYYCLKMSDNRQSNQNFQYEIMDINERTIGITNNT